MERVLFKVPLWHLSCETDQWFKVNICKFEQIMELENLVDQELQAWLVKNLIKVESIERSQIDTVKGHF